MRLTITLAVGLAVFAGLEALRIVGRGVFILGTLLSMLLAVIVYRAGTYAPGLRSIELYTDTLSRADALLLGALLAFVWSRGWIPQRAPMPLVLAAWSVLVWSALATTFNGPYLFRAGWTLIAIAGAIAIWGTLGDDETGYSRVLSVRPLRAIGQVSYGLYLWHALVFIAVGHWASELPALSRTGLALGFTAAITAGSWFFLEKPLLRYKSPRPGAPEAAGPTPADQTDNAPDADDPVDEQERAT
jgi:peptidoglycan/LPS O-acetylase OafA/YrhL